MRLQFLLIAASLLYSQGTASQVTAIFDPVTALAAYGVNVSSYSSSSSTKPNTKATASTSSTSKSAGCSFSCSALSLLYKNSISIQGSSSYNLLESEYWSDQQASVTSFCVFQPTNSTQVAVALLLSRLTQCQFAVRSGGHAAFAGASNVQRGLTINFSKMKDISVSSDQKVASLGPGNTWFDVYSNLEPKGLTVIGGRVAAIGVGGLTTGGGISFFSGLHGWACDNVHNFEVVTAAGAIVNANPSTNADLYFALRGGGNNFGIVTRFDLNAYPQGLMWGGARLHNISHSKAVIDAYVNFGKNAPSDPNAALIVAYAFAQGQFFASVDLEYALPVADAPIFDEFEAIPALSGITSVQSLSDITLEFNASNPSGLRETYWAAAFKLNDTLATYIVDTFMAEIDPIKNAAGIIPAAVLQVITTDMLSHMTQNGGNPLGLSVSDGPIMLLNLAFMWENESDDVAILKVNANIVNKSVAQSKAWGLDNPYIYMNYASQFQSVIASYGPANHARLVSIAKKYDPDGVFQTLQSGYFKLNGAPNPTGP